MTALMCHYNLFKLNKNILLSSNAYDAIAVALKFGSFVDKRSEAVDREGLGSLPFGRKQGIRRPDRREAKLFLKSVKDLQQAATSSSCWRIRVPSGLFVRAKNLMRVPMTRLDNEFYQILSTNRNYLDPESVSSQSSRVSSRSNASDFEDDALDCWRTRFRSLGIQFLKCITEFELAMSDLKAIADSMVSSGYSEECAEIYKSIRILIVDESLYYLRVERREVRL
ncbi:hypothetical protein U1Q18_019316 [Sarracenia purpurea var. burkii]